MVSERGWVIHHDFSVGAAIWSGIGEALPTVSATNDSWRVDETCIEVKGKQKYLYRAVDSAGQTLGFGWLLSGILLLRNAFSKAFKAFHTQPRLMSIRIQLIPKL